MKKLILMSIIVLAVFTSCKKDDVNTGEPKIPSMADLIVPANFDWKTTQTVSIMVNLPSNGEIQPLIITNYDGTSTYFRGFPDDGSRTLRTIVTIPAYVHELKLIYSGTTGPNVAYINNGTLAYDLSGSTKSLRTFNCDLTGFETYSQGGWFQTANGNNVGSIRDQYYTQVYPNPNDFVIGNTDLYTITFTGTSDVEAFSTGGNGDVLTQSYLNPTDKLGNMASQIVAAKLNRDYDAANFIGTNTEYELGQLIFADGPFANMSINEFLAMAEIALGGGDMNGYAESDYTSAAENVNTNFEGGDDGHFTCPNSGEGDPNIVLSSACSSPDVIFTLLNNGDGNMSAAQNYTLYKNSAEISSGTYQLDVNQTVDITASGTASDNFELVAESPTGQLTESIAGCDGPTAEQLAGSLAYEDLWPGTGDYDFNDLIIDYDFQITKDDQEVVQSMQATFVVKAFGASYHNGFGFTLPTVTPDQITSVTGYNVINNTVFDIGSNGLENGQSKATIIVFDDVRRIMPQTTGGIGVNTQLAYAYTEPVTIVVNIVFASNELTYTELNIGSFNPFLIVNTEINGAPGERGLEVHLPNYAPSDLFDDTYFGQFEDNSSVADGRYFVTENNLPWAINIAGEFDWVIEFQDITGAYNMFAEWAQSGGTSFPDWYQNTAGYRTNSLIYPTQIVK